jgi:hypothetical protein
MQQPRDIDHMVLSNLQGNCEIEDFEVQADIRIPLHVVGS